MQPNFRLSGIALTFSDVLFLLVFVTWVASLLLKPARFRFDNFYFLLLLYAVGLTLSAFFSLNPQFSLFKLSGEIYLLVLAVMTCNIVSTIEMFRRVAIAWLAASAVGCFIAIIAVFSFYFGFSHFITDFALHHYGSLSPGNYPRIQGTFIYPSMLCNYMTVSLFMLFAARKLEWISKAVFAFLLTSFSITIAFTITPGIGGVLLGAGLSGWIIFKDRSSHAASRLSLVAGILSGVAFILVSTFTLRAIATSPFYFSIYGIRVDPTQRLLTWLGSLDTFLQNPFLGKGLGLGVTEIDFLDPSGRLQLLTDAHQTWLNVAGQAGLAGVIPFLAISVIACVRSLPWKIGGNDIDVLRTYLGIAFAAAFLYQGLIGSFENARHLWVLIGLILAVSSLQSDVEMSESM